uniref:Eukaryotic translation initiation factor 3 subunit C n=1 Tax=Hirondellea gigas TaxID=1518452 RepID=A0A6A7G0B0_9CRUS
MSRFFAASDSESDSEGSDSDQGVGLGGQLLDGFQENAAGATLAARFIFEDSDSEDERRVVRSQKEKRFDELQSTIRLLKNHMKIRDWLHIASEYDKLQNQISNAKLSPVIKAEGVPRFYLKAIVLLCDFVELSYADKVARKKLSQSNAKSLSKLRQHLTKKNKLFIKELKEYRLNPDEDKEEESDESEAEDESKADDQDDNSDDSIDWDTDSNDSDGSVTAGTGGFSLNKDEITRDFWVKKASSSDKPLKKAKETKTVRVKTIKEKEETVKQQVDWTPELIQKKLQEVFKSRGRAGFDKKQAIIDLEEMNNHAQSSTAKVAVLCALIGALNDMNLNKSTYMNVRLWKQCLDVVARLVDVLRVSPELRLKELDEDDVGEEDLYDEGPEVDEFAQADQAAADEKARQNKPSSEEKKSKTDEVDESLGFETIRGNLYAYVTLLSREYRKSLQFLDFNEPSYAARREDEESLLTLVRKVCEYYEFIGNKKGKSRMCLIILEHIYQHHDEKQDIHNDLCNPDLLLKPSEFHGSIPVLEPPNDEVQQLCSFVFQAGDSRSKTHALLQRVTHYAIHNRYSHARDLLLMSHLADSIANGDVATKVLFNRTQAFLALAAFRCERYNSAMRILAEIYVTQRIKEILAQGVSGTRWNERDLQQEHIDRKRTFPNHLHISLDLLESVHLVSAMLLEIPNLALNPADDWKFQISRTFRRLYDQFLSDAFHGPPENTRDYILHAAVALSKGNWRLCNEHIMSLKMWSITPNEEKVRAQVTKSIKEAGLFTYLIVYGAQYVTLCLTNLAKMFELTVRDVHRILSRMIATKELHASLNQPAKTLIVHVKSSGYLQKMAISYSNKLNSFVDQNEKLLETVAGRSGGYSKRDNRDGDSSSHRRATASKTDSWKRF